MEDSVFVLFRLQKKGLRVDSRVLSQALSSCGSDRTLNVGIQVHCLAITTGFITNVYVGSCLITFYSKCGVLDNALRVFDEMPTKDLVSWNSMINGYSQHGLASQAICLFEEMKQQKMKPDAITFLGILSSCRHAGIVEEGWFYFNSMAEYGVKSELDHYSCIVDLLGRAGFVKDAWDFIKKMPISPNAVIWGSLLSSCRLHGNVWIGIEAAEERLVLRPWCSATHLQLANLYASVGCWDQAGRVRKMVKDKGMKNDPGFSWIEIKNEVYWFRAEDKSNTKVDAILALMNGLVDHMRGLVYVPEIHEHEFDCNLYGAI
ncbi:hypothetical protein LguiB_035205 [Lonicera macranthoides]